MILIRVSLRQNLVLKATGLSTDGGAVSSYKWFNSKPLHPSPHTPQLYTPQLYLLHLTPYTLRPTPYTLHPTPYNSDSVLVLLHFLLNPKPETLSLKPSTLNAQLQTLSPKP